ncbi:sigma-70 family RNA polymerase sigma factor [Massilimaliae timonensis]|uniref:Sigma-70 family RNA polymerase sigma factor n=1 Tax=Massiliimalia timonensis TaxID=1987501 RepID=A0A8J6TRR8_9FIRM|nr:sigma-70 family RNA polymerase sigma factor [Massiliimalia timonensis]MBC8611261.1 sigma-70 family RNA polymerase sigma factor [Massiliimalia timonensis]
MAYNKAKAEREWLRWKEAEEKKLRELGVDEETIQRLHTYDWAQFNKERQYLQRQVEWSPYIDLISAQDLELPVEDTESLLDSIEDIELFSLLHNVDKLTLEILFMKMDGYGSKEISEKTGLSVNAIDLRIFKLKKKIKKFL